MRNVVQQGRLQLYQDLREDRKKGGRGKCMSKRGGKIHFLLSEMYGQLGLRVCGTTSIVDL